MPNTRTFLGRALTIGVLAATTAGGTALVAPAAHAAPAAPAPPASAGYAPGTSMTPATGDGNGYWASDGCHYYTQAGQWWGDMCWVRPVDGSGRPVDSQWALVPRVAPNLPAASPFVMIETSDPRYSTIRVPTQPVFAIIEWMRTPVGGGPTDAQVFDSVTRTYVWIPMSELTRIVQQGQGPRYGFPSPSVRSGPASALDLRDFTRQADRNIYCAQIPLGYHDNARCDYL